MARISGSDSFPSAREFCGATLVPEDLGLMLEDCMAELEGLDWATARRVWAIHRDCLPGCRAQLAAGAALSSENQED